MGNNQSELDEMRGRNADLQRRTNELERRHEKWEHWINEQKKIFAEQARKLREAEQELNDKRAMKQKVSELRAKVNQYKPGSSMRYTDTVFPDMLNVGLFGTTGIGKTSLMNSLKYALYGELSDLEREQTAPADFQGGHTIRRLAVRLTQHITFIDNRGVGAEDLKNAGSTDEVIKQMEGRSSFVKPIEWRGTRKKFSLGSKEHRESEMIFCAVLVFDARKAMTYFEVVEKFVECLHKWQGRYPIAVVTNTDRATPQDIDNIDVVLRTAGIQDIYHVANITDRRQILDESQQLILLKLIERCVADSDRVYEFRLGIEKEKY